MARKLRSFVISIMLKPRYAALRRRLHELARQLTLKKRVVHVFLQVDDPYSYLLGHYLQFVVQRYKRVEFRYYLCQSLRGDFAPQPALQADYAINDCRLLAGELGIPFLDLGDTPVAEYRRQLIDFLGDEQDDEEFPQTFFDALSAYWRGDADAVLRLIGRAAPDQAATNVLVGRHQLLLRKLGHYQCATMYYGGEWYWGIDRLHYLLDRFAAQGLDRYSEATPELVALDQAMRLELPSTPPAAAAKLPPLEMYFSFRSPYAYIALERVGRLADAFGLQLSVRPVLPMVSRGLSLPKSKLLYIVRDANREAQRYERPFGRISDALGAGAERCIAVFYHAQAVGKEREFLAAAGAAIWSEAIDVASDDGMRVVAERAGLDWSGVQETLAGDAWREMAEQNRDALYALDLWGVPAFSIGDLSLWGQDRLWLLARRIQALCTAGETAKS